MTDVIKKLLSSFLLLVLASTNSTLLVAGKREGGDSSRKQQKMQEDLIVKGPTLDADTVRFLVHLFEIEEKEGEEIVRKAQGRSFNTVSLYFEEYERSVLKGAKKFVKLFAPTSSKGEQGDQGPAGVDGKDASMRMQYLSLSMGVIALVLAASSHEEVRALIILAMEDPNAFAHAIWEKAMKIPGLVKRLAAAGFDLAVTDLRPGTWKNIVEDVKADPVKTVTRVVGSAAVLGAALLGGVYVARKIGTKEQTVSPTRGNTSFDV